MSPNKEKWLALHNFRSNAEFFKAQLEPWLKHLENVEVEFVQAPHAARGPGFYPGDGFEWWYSPTYKSPMMGWLGDLGLDESMNFLKKKIEADGPYHGVIGFSQGGGMAHFLLGEGLVKKGILFSPVVPLRHDWPPTKGTPFKALVLFDPADITGEGYPVDGMEAITHAENHNIPVLTDEIRAKVDSWFVSP